MSWKHFLCALCAAGLLISFARGQSRQQQVDELRAQMQTLDRKIAELEGGNEAPSKHVTEIGGTRSSRKTEEPAEEVLILRMYDLSDLFAVAPPYLAQQVSDLSQAERPMFPVVQAPSVGAGFGGMGGFGGGLGGGGFGGGFMNVQSKPNRLPGDAGQTLHQMGAVTNNLSAAQTSVDSLIEAITTTIAPQGWDTVGGPGSIAVLGNAMLISANENTHKQIESLLSLFRQKWGSLRTVSVRAYWIWLTDGQLAELLQQGAVKDASPGNADGEKREPTALAEGGFAAQEQNGAVSRMAFGTVTEAAWQQLLKQAADAKDNQQGGYRAVVTCYNGQTVHTVSGGQSVFVTGMTPVVGGGSEGGVGYSPGVAIVQEGAALQVTPLTTSSGKYVVLDIHSRVNKLRPSKPAAEEPTGASHNGPAGVAAAIDRPVLMTHRLSTTLRVPVGQPTLIGGMTFESEPQPGEPNLYLFVQVAVQELRDADSEEKNSATEGSKVNPSGEQR